MALPRNTDNDRIFYSEWIKEHLENIRLMAQDLKKEDPGKSVEQFKAEIDFLIVFLKETQRMVD